MQETVPLPAFPLPEARNLSEAGAFISKTFRYRSNRGRGRTRTRPGFACIIFEKSEALRFRRIAFH